MGDLELLFIEYVGPYSWGSWRIYRGSFAMFLKRATIVLIKTNKLKFQIFYCMQNKFIMEYFNVMKAHK